MPREIARLTPLAARKQLLLAESDLNRAKLFENAVALSAGVKSATARVRSIGSMASAALGLIAGVATRRSPKTDVVGAGSPRLQAFLRIAGVLSTLCLTFYSRGQSKVNRKSSLGTTKSGPPS